MISAIVHTRNEEKNIDRCLSSLYWVDEIVVIDMGSEDDTCKKAATYKAKIHTYPYTGFVEPARNFGIEKAKGPWIFVLDADEEVPKSLADAIQEAVKKTEYSYYRIPRKNIIFDAWIEHGGWWPDYQVRLFKKGHVSWSEKIHGVPNTDGNGEDFPAEEANSIIHYNYQAIDQYLEKLNRYTSVTAKELYISSTKLSIQDMLGMPAKEFVHRYIVWQGYKDGLHGLALAVLQSVSELIVALKIWELQKFKKEKISLSQVRSLANKEHRNIEYWFLTELLKNKHSSLSTVILKIKRKLLRYG